MPSKSYVVWNNKGGAGKTTLTFQLSAAYAQLHPLEKIVVIDMCPQANVSSALLANKINPNVLLYPEEVTVSTVCDYLLAKLKRNNTELETTNLMDFLVHVNTTNKRIPTNLYLMCGDLYLEALSRKLEQERLLQTTPANDNPWKRVTLFIKDYIEGMSRQHVDCVFFIDTNPTFSIYTEMAISAAERLIVPFMADDFSLSAITAMFNLVYGYTTDENKRFNCLKEYQYYWLAKANNIQRPKLHLFVNNRATYYDTRASAAFSAAEISKFLNEVYWKNEDMFSSDFDASPGVLMDHIIDLPDFHSSGVVFYILVVLY
ncbi:unnamed protein product [Mytilus coruscus]|uniref:AAA domain-containing protein n=1 Tax=Mytilus coruscus TaxID=42192 RepID=A0A6J8BUH1_MYTCO|nr:unnamed protein product [Mytilus coruscus]